jgi:hypothetical protein
MDRLVEDAEVGNDYLRDMAVIFYQVRVKIIDTVNPTEEHSAVPTFKTGPFDELGA